MKRVVLTHSNCNFNLPYFDHLLLDAFLEISKTKQKYFLLANYCLKIDILFEEGFDRYYIEKHTKETYQGISTIVRGPETSETPETLLFSELNKEAQGWGDG